MKKPKHIEEQEDKELSTKYDKRLDIKEEEWIELPPEKTIIEHYKENKKKS